MFREHLFKKADTKRKTYHAQLVHRGLISIAHLPKIQLYKAQGIFLG